MSYLELSRTPPRQLSKPRQSQSLLVQATTKTMPSAPKVSIHSSFVRLIRSRKSFDAGAELS